MKNDIAIAERYRIPATTLSGILTVKTPRSEKPYKITEESIPDFARNIGKKGMFRAYLKMAVSEIARNIGKKECFVQ